MEPYTCGARYLANLADSAVNALDFSVRSCSRCFSSVMSEYTETVSASACRASQGDRAVLERTGGRQSAKPLSGERNDDEYVLLADRTFVALLA
jgi:hypothetical protein